MQEEIKNVNRPKLFPDDFYDDQQSKQKKIIQSDSSDSLKKNSDDDQDDPIKDLGSVHNSNNDGNNYNQQKFIKQNTQMFHQKRNQDTTYIQRENQNASLDQTKMQQLGNHSFISDEFTVMNRQDSESSGELFRDLGNNKQFESQIYYQDDDQLERVLEDQNIQEEEKIGESLKHDYNQYNEDIEILHGVNSNIDFPDDNFDDDDLIKNFGLKMFQQNNTNYLKLDVNQELMNREKSDSNNILYSPLPKTIDVNTIGSFYKKQPMELRAYSLSRSSVQSKSNDILSKFDMHKDFMEKQSPSFHKQWQKRYFVLENQMLKYFKNEKEYLSNSVPKGVLNFNQICVSQIFQEKDRKIELQIKGSNRKFLLRCNSQDSFNIWKQKLNYTIDNSLGKQKDLILSQYMNDINKTFDFWRFLRISESNFVEQVQVGDIILCYQKKKLSNSNNQSALENVVLVVRLVNEINEKSEVYIIRSGHNLDQAIIFQNWDEFRLFKSLKEWECCHRHLYIDRNDEFFNKTSQFIQNIRLKPFYISYPQNDPNNKNKQITKPQQRLYRSGELIAKYFQLIGILPRSDEKALQDEKIPQSQNNEVKVQKKSNYQYVPKDFSQYSKAQNLDLQNEAQLGDEQIIMFDEKEISKKMINLQKQSQNTSFIDRTMGKDYVAQKMDLDVINEEDIEQSIRMSRSQVDKMMSKKNII